MRTLAVLVIILFSFISYANEGDLINEVWIDGSTFYKSISHKKKSTIYFKEWSPFVEQFLTDENYFVALQLNKNFDPLPTDDTQLPSLSTLSAITNSQLVKQYFDFFVDFNRSKGISHLILPDTSNFNTYEKEVISIATTNYPYYFLPSSLFTYELPETKKEFIEKSNTRKVYVAKQDVNTKKLEKWTQKFIQSQKDPFLRSLSAFKKSEYEIVKSIPDDLTYEIFKSTVTAIDPNGIFPLKGRYLVYIGADNELKKELSNYFEIKETRENGIPVIVDLRHQNFLFEETDILLTNRIVEQASLAVLNDVDASALDLTKMFIGAEEIIGRTLTLGNRIIPNYHVVTYSEAKTHDSSHLIDSLVDHAISNFATPGAQIAVIQNNEIVLEKSYGYYTYDSLKKISKHTIYDLASLTKVLSTLPAIALLIDRGLISLDDPISKFLKEFNHSNKSTITIRQLLAHHGGLKAYIPFWKLALEGDRLDAFYYKTKQDEEQDIRSYGYEPDPILLDTLKSFLVDSDLIKKPNTYKYSDLGYMILHLIVQQVSNMSFEEFLYLNFYEPMALHYTCFNPLDKGFKYEDIAPTEYDRRYRNYQVWGEVHDRNALVFGGASGHAGLFSNATDIAKFMSMFLQHGQYSGNQYLNSETLYAFNKRYFLNNRRGLGWDKKDPEKELIPSELASDQSFGHSGFSGTFVWVDPKYDLIFVFLSNRIYPDANNRRLNQYSTRTNIHRVLYETLQKENETYIRKD